MKQAMRLLLVTGISVGLVACHSNPNQSTANVVDSNALAVTGVTKKDSAVAANKKAQADTAGLAAFKAAQKQRYEDSLKEVGARQARPAKATYASSHRSTRNSSAASGYAATSSTTAEVKKKDHSARNGALIGAGAGALTGALVTKKNRGVGALIGGVAGGAAGFGVGKIVENKNKKKDQ